MSLVSIIIPVYNGEKYLRDCLKSITQQDYSDLEIIIIDDGSTDSTREICKEFEQTDTRIRYVFQQNSGVAAARKNGLALAKADFVMFVDADDYLKKDCLSVLMQTMEEKHVDIVCCGSEDINGEKIELVNQFEDRYISDKDEIMNDYFKNSRYTYAIWGKVYKKEVFDGISFPNMKYAEDTLLNAYVFQNIKDLYLSSYVGYVYRMLPDSSTQTIKTYKKNYDLIQRDKGIYDICVQMNSSCLDMAKKRYILSVNYYINSVKLSAKDALKDRNEILDHIDRLLTFDVLTAKYRMKFLIYKYFGKLFLVLLSRGK